MPTQPQLFEEILAAAKRGEPRAFEQLYRANIAVVIGYLRANGASSPEDSAGDVFVAFVSELASFDGTERDLRSWLLTVAHRRLVDDFRVRSRRPQADLPPGSPGPVRSHLPGADTAALARLEQQGILDAIDSLSPDQRQVMMLRVLADQTVPQIAATVDKPETAVKALLRRGTARLHRALAATREVPSE